NLRSTSYAAYEQLIRNHITPAIGHIQLQKLTSQHVQTLYSQRLKDGYAPETVRAIHRMLHRAFSDAVEWKLIGYNVCAKGKVKQPRRVKHEIQPLTKEQAQALLAAAKGHWFLEALLTLAIATGMRRGELLALRWSDVDFAGQCLYVRRTVTRIGSKGLVKGLVESEPKTESSKRRILLPRFVLEALHLHRERQAQMRSLTEDWQDHDLVFSGKQGRYIEVTDLRFHFKKLLRKAGLPDIRIHDLRHSAATILLEMKVQPKLVQELLGHSNIGITMDLYSHVLPSMQRKMMEDLDDFFRDS
ncbi:MAG: site-specific integrase, partial [Ktedonobacteraceae bacterium]|nr:site-specific integrase [Ktedonobacteraceae bacterium]